MLTEIVDAQRIVDLAVQRSRRIVEGRAVLGDVQRHRAVALAKPDQDVGQPRRIHLPIGLGVRRARLPHAGGALDQLVRIVLGHAALVVVDADEVDRRADVVEVGR